MHKLGYISTVYSFNAVQNRNAGFLFYLYNHSFAQKYHSETFISNCSALCCIWSVVICCSFQPMRDRHICMPGTVRKNIIIIIITQVVINLAINHFWLKFPHREESGVVGNALVCPVKPGPCEGPSQSAELQDDSSSCIRVIRSSSCRGAQA